VLSNLNEKSTKLSVDTAFNYRLLAPSKHRYEMPSIWQLVAGNLAANGDVKPDAAMKAAKDAYFDHHDSTRVVSIRHSSGRLAGTFSVTMDSKEGMPVTNHFEQELNFLRKKYRMVNGWRFSMSPLFHEPYLRQRTLTLFKQLVGIYEADAFVIYFNERLSGYYSRYFNGRVIASKTISFDGRNELPVSLLLCESRQNPPNPQYMHNGALYEGTMVI